MKEINNWMNKYLLISLIFQRPERAHACTHYPSLPLALITAVPN